MASIPAKAAARVAASLKRFQPVLEDARKRDVNESDTVTIVTDLLSELFGYDKYNEITSEHSVRSTFCDLVVKLDGELAVLIEVKAIGLELKDTHITQAVNYAANQGVEWVALTNGILWNVYKVIFGKPIDAELVLELNLLGLSHRKEPDVDLLALLSREAWQKSRLDDYAVHKQALSRFSIAAAILSESSLQALRRELRRISRNVTVKTADIERVLVQDVIKREVIEGEKAEAARRLITKAAKRAKRIAERTAPTPKAPSAGAG